MKGGNRISLQTIPNRSSPYRSLSHMLSILTQSMMRFNKVEALEAYLVNLEELYEPYAEGMWNLGKIRSTEMIANTTKEDLANVLAHPEPPGPSHQIHASDLIARSRLAGMPMEGAIQCDLRYASPHGDGDCHPQHACLSLNPYAHAERASCIPTCIW